MKWISVKDLIPELKDDSILAYFSENASIETVHIEDYFKPLTAGIDADGNQMYTCWYITRQVTHWMYLPDPPEGTV